MGWNVECDVLLLGLNERWLFFFFGKRKCEKCSIIDENVRNMPQEAKSALAFTLFYTYGMGPEGDPFRSCKTNVDF